MEEFESAYGYSFTEVSENIVKNCPQSEFSLFADILAEVQKALYVWVDKQLVEDASLTSKAKGYLEGLLDRNHETLRGKYAPYDLYSDEAAENYIVESKFWFNGFVAKTMTCEGDSSVTSDRYKEWYDDIYQECVEIIEAEIKNAK